MSLAGQEVAEDDLELLTVLPSSPKDQDYKSAPPILAYMVVGDRPSSCMFGKHSPTTRQDGSL